MKELRLKARSLLPKCQKRGCKQKAKTLRSKFCSECFVQRAGLSGARSSGNIKKGISKKRAGASSSGNNTKGISKKRAGACSSGNKTKGISKKRAGASSSGNRKKGNAKKRAGQQSGLRRRAAIALIIKTPWLEKIFKRDKQWEIRGTATTRRGRIHLAQPGGLLVGSAVLSGCTLVERKDFLKHKDKHCIHSLNLVTYPKLWAWHLGDVQRYSKPFRYTKPNGAIVWVRPKPWRCSA